MPTVNYRVDGKRVPGTTTVVGRFKESGGLIHWAWDLGMQGINYRDARDTAASTGTTGHALIEQRIKGLEPVCDFSGTAEQQQQAMKCLEAFDTWADQNKMEIIATEMHLVSPQYRFGGTPDAVAILNGKPTLLDFKTSNKTYGEYAIQVAAYRHLLNDGKLFDVETPDELVNTEYGKIKDAHLLRIGKEFAEFHHSFWGEDVMDYCWDAFVQMRELYDKLARIKKLA